MFKPFTLTLSLLLWFHVSQAQPTDTDTLNQPYAIPEAVVTGTRNKTDLRYLPMTLSIVDRQMIEQSHRSSLLPTLTEQVPGLFITGRGIMGYGVSTGASGGMTLRGIGNGAQGSPTTGMLVLIDGHPQYMGLMGHPIADAYQSMLAERVEVLRGPASVLYGSNAMGGVLNIITRKIKQDGVRSHLNLSYGSFQTLQTEASSSIQSGRFSSIVTASYNRTDGHRENMGFEQYGGYVKMGYQLTRAWKLWADLNLTHFNASNPGSVTAPLLDNDSRITRGVTSVVVENEYAHTSGALSFFYNWGRHTINDGYAPGAQPLEYHFNSRDRMMGVSWYQSASFFAGNRITVGVDYQHFGGKAWNYYLQSHENKTTADKTQNEVAGYLDFRQSVGRWLSLDAGLRLDHHSHVGTEWIPQGGATFYLSRSASLKAMVSKGFRFPTLREMYMFPPQNPNLKSERLMSYEVAFAQRLLAGKLSYGLNLYYIHGENMIMRVPVDGRPLNINTGSVRNYGLEVELSYALNAMWSVSANYSWLHMKYPVIAAPQHKLFAGVYFQRQRWSASTGVQYIHGLYTAVNPDTQEHFVLWSAQASFRATRFLELFVRGENLLAQRYEINAGYPMPRATILSGLNFNF
ncbi:MAG: TonB-dependent receptor [Alistipes sp.]|nr:TonB-dependent receptor [Alistipes sp.]